MKMNSFVFKGLIAFGVGGFLTVAHAAEPAVMTIPVDSPAFVFSPGNWVGDTGRGGSRFRQTWNSLAYFRVAWESTTTNVVPTLLLDTSTYSRAFSNPRLVTELDGLWDGEVSCRAEIPLKGAVKPGKHVLTVYMRSSSELLRWGVAGQSGSNVVRITGLKVEANSKPIADAPRPKWALIIGDSITQGVGAYDMSCYAHLVGQGLQTQGYEYCVSACGWSGWLNRGDNPPGDVPGYYVITNSVNGAGGQYLDALSRWNKIDANHSFLDAQKHLSAYGETGQEPTVITINYGTNDSLWRQNPSDVQASIAQAIPALRQAAPKAYIFILIPFGQFQSKTLYETVAAYQGAHPKDRRISIIDMGAEVAVSLAAPKGYWGGLHPNPRAHATFATKITAQIMATLCASDK